MDSSLKINDDQVIAYVAGKMQKFLKMVPLQQENAWRELKEKDGIKMHKRPDSSTGIDILRAETVFDQPPDFVYEILAKDDNSGRECETDVESIVAIKEINDRTIIYYFQSKQMFMVSQRDFVTALTSKELGGDKYCVYTCSIDIEQVPVLKDFVRGDLMISGYLIEGIQGNQKSRVSTVQQVDIKGSIPLAIVNTLLQDQAKTLFNYSQYCQKKYKPN